VGGGKRTFSSCTFFKYFYEIFWIKKFITKICLKNFFLRFFYLIFLGRIFALIWMNFMTLCDSEISYFILFSSVIDVFSLLKRQFYVTETEMKSQGMKSTKNLYNLKNFSFKIKISYFLKIKGWKLLLKKIFSSSHPYKNHFCLNFHA
jgi:hypothetical protein